MPKDTGYANLNTAAFDRNGVLWFTGQSRIYSRLDPRNGEIKVFDARADAGPTASRRRRRERSTTPHSAGSHIARIDIETGAATVIEPPTPGQGKWPRAYAVYVDENDAVWLSDFGANATVRFDPRTETFTSFPSPRSGARVRQLLGRPGEVWAPESGTYTLVVIRTE